MAGKLMVCPGASKCALREECGHATKHALCDQCADERPCIPARPQPKPYIRLWHALYNPNDLWRWTYYAGGHPVAVSPGSGWNRPNKARKAAAQLFPGVEIREGR